MFIIRIKHEGISNAFLGDESLRKVAEEVEAELATALDAAHLMRRSLLNVKNDEDCQMQSSSFFT